MTSRSGVVARIGSQSDFMLRIFNIDVPIAGPSYRSRTRCHPGFAGGAIIRGISMGIQRMSGTPLTSSRTTQRNDGIRRAGAARCYWLPLFVGEVYGRRDQSVFAITRPARGRCLRRRSVAVWNWAERNACRLPTAQ
jgi:hypothetical protein